MSLTEGPVKELDDKFLDLIGKFVSDIKNGYVWLFLHF